MTEINTVEVLSLLQKFMSKRDKPFNSVIKTSTGIYNAAKATFTVMLQIIEKQKTRSGV